MSQSLSSSPPPGPDWTAQAADRIESVVEVVRDKTAVPVTKAARALVYGLIAAVTGLLALVLLVIGLFRLHVYLPFDDEGRKVYATYFFVGGLFLVLGTFLWRRRGPTTKG